MPSPIVISFLFFLLSFIVVGGLSALRGKSTTEDYLVASRSVNPWAVALSAAATNNSGYMFIGLIGYVYAVGVSGSWLMVGWISGDYLAWHWVHRKLRERSHEQGAVTIPSFLGAGLGPNGRWVIRLAAIVTLLFLGVYAAAQLKAGSKALAVLFGWDLAAGAVIGAVIVGIYSLAGGIRASIWTDVLQALLMLASMSALLAAALARTGGVTGLWSSLAAIDPALVDPVPQNLKFGFAAYLVSWIVAGLGVVGQPHIMVRAMTIDHPGNISVARRVYVVWYALFSAVCIIVGLTARVLLDPSSAADPELALPLLATDLFPPLLVGMVLAGLFAATMSTADSQILSCSAAWTQDLFPRWRESYWHAKAGTLLTTMLVLGIALSGSAGVFALVVPAWSALASALGPLLVVQALRRPIGVGTALGMISTGLLCMLAWRYGLGLSDSIYDVLPGMAGGALFYLAKERRHAGNDSRQTEARRGSW
ncbi:MAG TPA: sodium/proline symporter [Vicinamibacteria bacterium]|nr:sodium/proline symporter [Vicinamibacteria bacterium]